MRNIVKALLAASMLVPAAAQAQEVVDPSLNTGQSRRAELRQIREQARAERGDRGPDQSPSFATPQPRQDRQDRQPPEARQGGFSPRQDGGFAQRRDGGFSARSEGGFARRQDGAPQRQDGFAPPRRGPEQQPGGLAQRQDGRRDGRPDGRQGGWQNRGDDRPSFRTDRRDDRPDFRNDRPRVAQRGQQWGGQQWGGQQWNRQQWGRNDDWRDNRDAQRRFDDRRSWNRDWRSDSRYNYDRYRSANRRAFSLPRYYAPSGWGYGYRRFSIGATLSSLLWNQSYWIDDPYAYRLPDAYGPYRWVRYYDDALLIDIRTGRVVDMVYDIFY